ncbi:hypothetical protein CL654_02810 [bacterium]|nr:hypothetical protein [bacterium]|tara:strand:- start:11444 stop:12544 length:1101 start_codon:yes stop_codon:yes gene_type:complete
MKEITIPQSNKSIGGDEVFIIAEIGKNFIQTQEEKTVSEYLDNAKKLVDAAVDAGCDAVKFQTHIVLDEQANIDIVSPHFKGSDRYSWVARNTNITPREGFWEPLKEYCDQKGIIFFSTPMSRGAAQKVDDLVSLWKVGSGDVQDYILMDYISDTGKPIIISTGMVSIDELHKILEDYKSARSPFIVLYCISKYPCPKEEFNLATIQYLAEKYPNTPIGFSDHSIGDEAALVAVKVGARVIEKHFSFSRELWGSDHKVSMTPREMKEMVLKIRNGHFKDIDETPYLGEDTKEFEGATNQFRPYFNKTLVAGKDIKKGEVLTKEMIFAMRPKMYLDGTPSDRVKDIVGKKVTKDIKQYEPIKNEHLE